MWDNGRLLRYTVRMIRVFTSKTQALGEKGEEEAVKHLRSRGFSIIDRNVPNKFGEIDIVAKKKGVVHFFEVKAGYANGWFNPADNLTKAKLRKFLISAEHYALRNRIGGYRVQALLVLFGQNGEVSVESIDLF